MTPGKKGKLLITGGSGMVGRNIQEHQASAGWQILAPSSRQLDLRDRMAVNSYMAEHHPDVVIHAAGRVGGIQANIANPVAFLDENLALGQNVIMAARKNEVRTLLNLASTCVYPAGHDKPLTEDMILTGALEPTNEGYAIAKIAALRLCEYIRRETPQMNYKTLVPCNLYGRHDKFDPAHSHLVPAIIHKIHEARRLGLPEVEIWGDGSARREFLYAGDLADAAWRAIADIESLPDVMNIGLGHDYSINEYYAAVAEIVGWQGKFVHDLTRPIGMKRKLSSTDRLNSWGWKAPTRLKDGLLQTYSFYLEKVGS